MATEEKKTKPRNFRFLHVRVSLKLLAQLQETATAQGKTVNVFVRELIRANVTPTAE